MYMTKNTHIYKYILYNKYLYWITKILFEAFIILNCRLILMENNLFIHNSINVGLNLYIFIYIYIYIIYIYIYVYILTLHLLSEAERY